jgi:hypothetical protein
MALKRMYNGMKKARELYKSYPDRPEGFLKWRANARTFFDKLGY